MAIPVQQFQLQKLATVKPAELVLLLWHIVQPHEAITVLLRSPKMCQNQPSMMDRTCLRCPAVVRMSSIMPQFLYALMPEGFPVEPFLLSSAIVRILQMILRKVTQRASPGIVYPYQLRAALDQVASLVVSPIRTSKEPEQGAPPIGQLHQSPADALVPMAQAVPVAASPGRTSKGPEQEAPSIEHGSSSSECDRHRLPKY